jgi:phosphodiesterase/alkaline phosphatase D-like protein
MVPRSSLKYEPPVHVEWIWLGALTADSATVKAKLLEGSLDAVLRLSSQFDFEEARTVEASSVSAETRVARFDFGELETDSTYFYAVESGGVIDNVRMGRFRTPSDGPFSFTVAIRSCASTGSNAAVFDQIRMQQPLLFLHLGDLHYQDLAVDDPGAYRLAYDHVLASPSQSLLYRNTAIVYVWDDHDFGGNDCDSTNPGSRAVRRAYQDYVPHYPLVEGEGDVAIYHSFAIGRVLFIVSDLRSERSAAKQLDDSSKTMLGERQKEWFKESLLIGKESYSLVVWVTSVPWIGEPEEGADFWSGFSTERAELASFLEQEKVDGLLVLSADAHMLAIDDGSNSTFSDSGRRGFPVFQSGALDRPGHSKGGPYSHGTYPGGGHFGLMKVMDSGDSLSVRWSGRDWAGKEIVSLEFKVPTN